MAISKAQQKAVTKYVTEHYDEFKIRMPKGSKEVAKTRAESLGLSVNGYFKKLLDVDVVEHIIKKEQ